MPGHPCYFLDMPRSPLWSSSWMSYRPFSKSVRPSPKRRAITVSLHINLSHEQRLNACWRHQLLHVTSTLIGHKMTTTKGTYLVLWYDTGKGIKQASHHNTRWTMMGYWVRLPYWVCCHFRITALVSRGQCTTRSNKQWLLHVPLGLTNSGYYIYHQIHQDFVYCTVQTESLN